MTLYASTKVPGCMTFWAIGTNNHNAYMAVEVFEQREASAKAVPFNYAIRFGKLDHDLEYYFGNCYKIAKEDFELQMKYALDNFGTFTTT